MYGLHSSGARKLLWEELAHVVGSVDVPWVAIRDFNVVYEVGHREGGNVVATHEMVDALEFINAYHIGNLNSVGHYFSWHNIDNNGSGIRSRIDHCFRNDIWFSKFPNSVVQYLNPILSDRTPLKLSVNVEVVQGGRPFRYFNHLLMHP